MERDKAISGTVEGGKRTAATLKMRYGSNYYERLGARGGAAASKSGFGMLGIRKDSKTKRRLT